MQSQAAAAVVTMDTDLQRHGEIGRLKEEGGGGGVNGFNFIQHSRKQKKC